MTRLIRLSSSKPLQTPVIRLRELIHLTSRNNFERSAVHTGLSPQQRSNNSPLFCAHCQPLKLSFGYGSYYDDISGAARLDMAYFRTSAVRATQPSYS